MVVLVPLAPLVTILMGSPGSRCRIPLAQSLPGGVDSFTWQNVFCKTWLFLFVVINIDFKILPGKWIKPKSMKYSIIFTNAPCQLPAMVNILVLVLVANNGQHFTRFLWNNLWSLNNDRSSSQRKLNSELCTWRQVEHQCCDSRHYYHIQEVLVNIQ